MFGLYKVNHQGFYPGIGIGAEGDEGIFPDFQLVYGSLFNYSFEYFNAVGSLRTKDLFSHFTDGGLDVLKVAFIGNMKRDLIPDIGEFFPGVVKDSLTEQETIRKPDQAAAGKVIGKIVSAKFPERGVEIVDLDDIAGEFSHLDPVAHFIGSADHDIEPANE